MSKSPRPARPSQSSPPRQSSHKKTKSKDIKLKDSHPSQTSYKPIDFAKERSTILETIAASQQASTNLTNSLRRLNRETTHPDDDPQISQLYRQCRKLRREILIYIQRTENEEWIGTLINANEELVQSLAHYEKASKPVEQDSDSDAWSASDSDGEGKKKVQKMNTGGSGRSSIAEDLAHRLRATSISKAPEKPPPKPPRPVKEVPPARPPRPQAVSSYVNRYLVELIKF